MMQQYPYHYPMGLDSVYLPSPTSSSEANNSDSTRRQTPMDVILIDTPTSCQLTSPEPFISPSHAVGGSMKNWPMTWGIQPHKLTSPRHQTQHQMTGASLQLDDNNIQPSTQHASSPKHTKQTSLPPLSLVRTHSLENVPLSEHCGAISQFVLQRFWYPRYGVLDATHLDIFTNEQQFTTKQPPIERIELKGVEVRTLPATSEAATTTSFGFVVLHRPTRNWVVLSSSTEKARQEWLRALKVATDCANGIFPSPKNVLKSPRSVNHPTVTIPITPVPSTSTSCFDCDSTFSFFNRRLTCGFCENSFCEVCCSSTCHVPDQSGRQKVCVTCCRFLTIIKLEVKNPGLSIRIATTPSNSTDRIPLISPPVTERSTASTITPETMNSSNWSSPSTTFTSLSTDTTQRDSRSRNSMSSGTPSRNNSHFSPSGSARSRLSSVDQNTPRLSRLSLTNSPRDEVGKKQMIRIASKLGLDAMIQSTKNSKNNSSTTNSPLQSKSSTPATSRRPSLHHLQSDGLPIKSPSNADTVCHASCTIM